MSKSISFVTSIGGSISPNTSSLASFSCDNKVVDEVKATLDATATFNRTYGEWEMADGSIVHLWSAGIYAKLPWYYMAYDCAESDAIRYRRANPTPDTSHE